MPRHRLHCFAQSGHAYRVALYLQCAGLDWEPVYVDFFGGQTRDPAWRASVNEMGEVPVLEVEGKRLTQSGAILTQLAEQTGAFAPEGDEERLEALRWLLFDNHKFTANFATHRYLRSFAPQAPDPAVLAFLRGRVEGALGIVEQHLAGRPFVLGARPTIADFSLVGYLYYPSEETGFDLAATHPNIHAWTARMQALPRWQHPYALMPGERLQPRHV